MKENLKESKNETRMLQDKSIFYERAGEDSALRICDFEKQLKHMKTVLQQRQEREEEFLVGLREFEEENTALKEQNNTLIRNNSSFDDEKRDLERSNIRVAKDVAALKKTMERLQKERLGFEESLYETSQEKNKINKTLGETQRENQQLREEVQTLHMIVQELEDKHTQR